MNSAMIAGVSNVESVAVSRLLCGLFLAVATAGPGEGDVVELANGNSFEDVVATVEGETVRIEFAFGEMSVPKSSVSGILDDTSPIERFLSEFERLERSPAGSAEDWWELAREAREAGLDSAYRRALSRAADLDPRLGAIQGAMKELGRIFDPVEQRWTDRPPQRPAMTAAEAERSPGFESRAAERNRAERERLLEAIELLALAQLVEQLEKRESSPPPAPAPAIQFVGAVGGYGFVPTAHNREVVEQLTRRQPGSLLPVVSPVRSSAGADGRRPPARNRSSLLRSDR